MFQFGFTYSIAGFNISFGELLLACGVIIIKGQCAEKGLIFDSRVEGRAGVWYIGDDMKLKQVLIDTMTADCRRPWGQGIWTLSDISSGYVNEYTGSTYRDLSGDFGYEKI